MKQPDLGKKISELRLAKGLTQGELAEKCNLSLRTIQRIESAEVTPRSYTVKLIFSNLEYKIYNSFGKLSYRVDRIAYKVQIWLGQFYRYVLDLFNLKTNTMRKLTTLIAISLLISIGIFFSTIKSNAQSISDVKDIIHQSDVNYMKWFNNGEIDSLITLYRYDACIVSKGCGKEFIRNYFSNQMNMGYKFKEVEILSLSVSDTIAVEKNSWLIEFSSGQKLRGMSLVEWRLTDEKWLMVNDIADSQ